MPIRFDCALAVMTGNEGFIQAGKYLLLILTHPDRGFVINKDFIGTDGIARDDSAAIPDSIARLCAGTGVLVIEEASGE